MVSVVMNCGECGASDGAVIDSSKVSGFVGCVVCGALIDIGHAYRHSGWCVVCGEEPSECVCGGGL